MQKDLFDNQESSEKENTEPKKKVRENEFEWNQFCRLGEMIGDGLHHESDGKWITREYKRLSKILIPEIKEREKEQRKLKAIKINEQMDKILEKNKCSCGGNLKQKRSGSKVCYCLDCNNRYVANYKKKK